MTPVAIEADYAEELEGTLRRWQRSDIELPLHRGPKQVAVSVWAAGWASTGVFDVIGMEEAWSRLVREAQVDDREEVWQILRERPQLLRTILEGIQRARGSGRFDGVQLHVERAGPFAELFVTVVGVGRPEDVFAAWREQLRDWRRALDAVADGVTVWVVPTTKNSEA